MLSELIFFSIGPSLMIRSSQGGIGWHTAYYLAVNGSKVYVGARSEEKADSGIKKMKHAAGRIELDLHPFVMDLSNLKGVKKMAEEFLQKEVRLDILINNAAM